MVAPADVDGIGDHGEAWCAHPNVELRVEELLALAREQALLLGRGLGSLESRPSCRNEGWG